MNTLKLVTRAHKLQCTYMHMPVDLWCFHSPLQVGALSPSPEPSL